MRNAILNLIPKTVALVSVSYDDTLHGMEDAILKSIRAGDMEALENAVEGRIDWGYGITDYLTALRDDIADAFRVTAERAEQFVDEHRDELVDLLLERDISDPVNDMLKNTRDMVAFYDLGIEIAETWSMQKVEFARARRAIRRALRIKGKDFDQEITELLVNASSGGQLVIYFNIKIREFIDHSDADAIEFVHPHVAIINTVDGSGYDVYLPGHTVLVGYSKNNVFLDKLYRYNYTFAVCGMPPDWCRHTKVTLSKAKTSPCPQSSIGALLDIEMKYEKTFKAGGCTGGDMSVKRHRNVRYENDFPCGLRCPHCGTFWVD